MLKVLVLALLSFPALADTVVIADMKNQVLYTGKECKTDFYKLAPMDEYNSELTLTCRSLTKVVISRPVPTPRYVPMGYVRVNHPGGIYEPPTPNLWYQAEQDGKTTYYIQSFEARD